jgi:hypothetical protein
MAFGPPTIAAQRSCENAQGLVIRRRNQWGARRSYTDENPVTHPASFLFLHISITNPSSYSSNDKHAQAVENIGISRFPNTGISYNAGIMPNGQIYEFQPLGRRGAHTVNTFNRRTCSTSGCPSRGTSLGSNNNLNFNARAIVLCQNVGNTVTSTQVHNIAKVAATWKRCGYVTRGARWHGHRCVTAKDCPGSKAWALMGQVNSLTEHYTVNGLTGEDDDWMSFIDNQAEFDAAVAKAMSKWWNEKMDLSGGPFAVNAETARLRGVPIQQMVGRVQPDGSFTNVHTVLGFAYALAVAFGINRELTGKPAPLLDALLAANDDAQVASVLEAINAIQVPTDPEPTPNP